MTAGFRTPGFLQSNDSFCDGIMQSLLCDGRPPAPIAMRHLSLRIGRRSLRDARVHMRSGSATGLVWPIKYLSAASRLASTRRALREAGTDLLYVWRGVAGRAEIAALAAEAEDIPRVYFEGGPIRGWVFADMQGVSARSSIPRDPRFFRRWRSEAGRPALDWRSLRETLTVSTPKRSLVSQDRRADWSGEGPFLFCPFQMNAPGDVLPDGGWVADAGDLVAALAQTSSALPAGWHLRLKPHPNARGELDPLVARHPGARLIVDKDTNSLDQLAASRGVVTVNSAMGLEAFFFDKPVIVLGASYYSGQGRTRTAASAPELADLLADPDSLDFDETARSDLMDFLFNDYFVRVETLKEGRFDVASLIERHARHRALLDRATAAA